MTGSSSGGPEQKDDKRLNEDLVVFMRKRSDTDAPRYTARLKTYVDLQHKRRRAAAARRYTENAPHDRTASKKKTDEQKDKGPTPANPNDEEQRGRRRLAGDKGSIRSRSCSEDQSMDAAGYRRRRRCCHRRRRRRSRRRRSCRRRRRRRSCSRRRRRRRRRSCSRRRRRRYTRRRRHTRRRRRRCR